MKCEMDCVACLVKQALGAARFVTDNEELHEALVERVMELAAAADMRQPPPAIAQQIHRVVREMTGVADPYAQVKRRFNRFAMDLYPKLYRRIAQSADPADTALRYAIAGNTIDFGVGVELSEADVDQAIDDAMHLPLYGTIDRFWQAVEQAHDILYLADNAGEVVFDRLLIERMPMRRLTVAVRGGPIINDATMEDAEAVGLTNVVEVIDNGSDAPGTILTMADDAHQLDEDVQARPGGVLERVADGVADDRGAVRGGVLAAVVTGLDVLLGVVPGAAGVGQEHRQREARGETADQQPDDPATPNSRPTSTGAAMAISDGRIISRWAPSGGDGHAALVVRVLGALEDARVLVELAAHLLTICCAARPTASTVRPLKAKATMAPRNSDTMSTTGFSRVTL
jgi:uncharacterized protein with ATP-grasp and redox domains